MLRFFIVFLFLGFGQAHAAHHLSNKFEQKQVNVSGGAVDTVKYTQKGVILQTKFSYAELFYQRNYGEDKLFVNGDSLNEALKKSIAESKYKSSALELMGAQGWELSSTIYRETTGGYEIIFFLKKKIE